MRRFLLLLTLCCGAGAALIYHPKTPLPDGWNPTVPFSVDHAPTPLTDWKLTKLLTQPGACTATLASHATLDALPALEATADCGIADRVRLQEVGDARMRPFETTCEIALRLALWERHGLTPAAQATFGQGIREIRHFSSYSCRKIRTSQGGSDSWSTHATARAVDVSGFVLEDGTLVDLKQHWQGDDEKARFLRQAQDTACDAFGLVLGPEYNALHADHFHIQLDWEGCR